MRCSGLANVLSGVALIWRTSSGPMFRADHTVIDTGHHRLTRLRVTSANSRVGPFRFHSSDERPLSAHTCRYSGDQRMTRIAPDCVKTRKLSENGASGANFFVPPSL